MKRTNYDSEFCGNLPLHHTNLIQPYGILLVVDQQSHEIIQASENTDTVFGKPVEDVVNSFLKDYIGEDSLLALQQKLNSHTLGHSIPSIWEINGKQFLVLVHRKPEYLLIEIDAQHLTPDKQESFINVHQELKYTMSAIEAVSTLQEICTLAANELKRISGFDKVMIYEFDADWNGTVVAEASEPQMELYLGFTFPASDIPKQARQLYLKNPYRFIPDREYQPVRLYPVINPATEAFLDLSDCNVRSVAAVHLEYLKNMSVTASMSTRILHYDKLWGLIACHHRTPKPMSYEMCSIFEMLSSFISLKITSLQNQSAHAIESRVSTTYADLVETTYKTRSLRSTLLSPQSILKLFNATGAVISHNRKFQVMGETPAREDLEELLLWIHTRELKRNFHTDSLGNEYDYAKRFADVGSGLLVIPISYIRDEYLMVFRPEQVRIINWGGNPDERIVFEKNEKNYHPRNSFKQWQQKVSGVSLPWREEELKIAETLRSFIYEYETSPAA